MINMLTIQKMFRQQMFWKKNHNIFLYEFKNEINRSLMCNQEAWLLQEHKSRDNNHILHPPFHSHQTVIQDTPAVSSD